MELSQFSQNTQDEIDIRVNEAAAEPEDADEGITQAAIGMSEN